MIEGNTINVLIDHREEQGSGVAVLSLVATSGQTLPEFEAGAHIDVQIDQDLVRQYSLSNPPGSNDRYRIGVLNDPESRGGSVAVFQDFRVGQEITISVPRNHFAVAEHESPALLIAGGIGITPILAMAYELRQAGRDFEIYYCLRQPNAGAFVDELQREFPDQLQVHYDTGNKFDPATTFGHHASEAHVYVCGPTGFMDWVIASAKDLGIKDQNIHFEYFSADVDVAGEEFEVYCAESDQTVVVGPDQTIAKALAAAGIKVDVSCEQGVCGTCITDVLEGEPDHRDHFLTDEEKQDNDQMALCCSRAKGPRLVIEI